MYRIIDIVNLIVFYLIKYYILQCIVSGGTSEVLQLGGVLLRSVIHEPERSKKIQLTTLQTSTSKRLKLLEVTLNWRQV